MGKQWKQWQILFSWAPKPLQMVTAAMKFKKTLLLRRKAMKNLDCVLESKDTTLPTKVCIVKAMVFPVVVYGCESWTVKKAEHWRIDAFELWCWRRLLKVPWTARRSNQLILKEINPEYSLKGLLLKLKLHYFGHLMWRAESLKWRDACSLEASINGFPILCAFSLFPFCKMFKMAFHTGAKWSLIVLLILMPLINHDVQHFGNFFLNSVMRIYGWKIGTANF